MNKVANDQQVMLCKQAAVDRFMQYGVNEKTASDLFDALLVKMGQSSDWLDTPKDLPGNFPLAERKRMNRALKANTSGDVFSPHASNTVVGFSGDRIIVPNRSEQAYKVAPTHFDTKDYKSNILNRDALRSYDMLRLRNTPRDSFKGLLNKGFQQPQINAIMEAINRGQIQAKAQPRPPIASNTGTV